MHDNRKITLIPFYIGPPIPIRELSIPSNKPTTTKPSQIMLHIIIQGHKLLRSNKRKTSYISNGMTYLSWGILIFIINLDSFRDLKLGKSLHKPNSPNLR